MKKLCIAIALLAATVTGQAMASLDITCLERDCLTNGWSIFDSASGQRQTVRCEENDCRTKGWFDGRSARSSASETECLDDSCWGTGWTTYDRRSGNFISETLCVRGNCMTNGWETHNWDGRYVRTVCMDRDCANIGWEAHSQGRFFSARCKSAGCFVSGWNLYP